MGLSDIFRNNNDKHPQDANQCVLRLFDDDSSMLPGNIATSFFSFTSFSPFGNDAKLSRQFFDKYLLPGFQNNEKTANLTRKITRAITKRLPFSVLANTANDDFTNSLYYIFADSQSAREFLRNALRLEIMQTHVLSSPENNPPETTYERIFHKITSKFIVSVYGTYDQYLRLLRQIDKHVARGRDLTPQQQAKIQEIEDKFKQLGIANIQRFRQTLTERAKTDITLDKVLHCIYKNDPDYRASLITISDDKCEYITITELDKKIAEAITHAVEALTEACLLRLLFFSRQLSYYSTAFVTVTPYHTVGGRISTKDFTHFLQQAHEQGAEKALRDFTIQVSAHSGLHTWGNCNLSELCVDCDTDTRINAPQTVKQLSIYSYNRLPTSYIKDGFDIAVKLLDLNSDVNDIFDNSGREQGEQALRFALDVIDLLLYEALLDAFNKINGETEDSNIYRVQYSRDYLRRLIKRISLVHDLRQRKLSASSDFSNLSYLLYRTYKYRDIYWKITSDLSQELPNQQAAIKIDFIAPIKEIIRSELTQVTPQFSVELRDSPSELSRFMVKLLSGLSNQRGKMIVRAHNPRQSSKMRLLSVVEWALMMHGLYQDNVDTDELGDAMLSVIKSTSEDMLEAWHTTDVLHMCDAVSDVDKCYRTFFDMFISGDADTHLQAESARNALYGASLIALLPVLTGKEAVTLSADAIKHAQNLLDKIVTISVPTPPHEMALIPPLGVIPAINVTVNETYHPSLMFTNTTVAFDMMPNCNNNMCNASPIRFVVSILNDDAVAVSWERSKNVTQKKSFPILISPSMGYDDFNNRTMLITPESKEIVMIAQKNTKGENTLLIDEEALRR